MRQGDDKIPLRRHAVSHLETYDVTAQELKAIERESLDVGQDFQFASNAFSIGATLLVALVLTEIASPTRYACFFAVMVAMLALAAYFGIQYRRKRRATRSTIQEIRERQLGPLGEEGHEISLSELAEAPSEPENPDDSRKPGTKP